VATRIPVITYGPNGQHNAVLVVWSGLLNGDDGTPFEHADFGDRSVQFQGTPGAAPSISLQGSNDASNYVILTDPQGNVITKTAAGTLETVEENTRYMRPIVTAGDGTTNWTVSMWGRRNR
jgi:hypothetical protein